MENKQRLWELMAKQISGTLTREEEVELEDLLQANKEVAQQQQLLEKVSLNSAGKLSTDQKEVLLDRIMGNIAAESTAIGTAEEVPRSGKKLWMATICLLVAMAAGLGYWGWSGKERAVEWSIVQTKPGSKSRITLPDGTLVVLNAGSILSYPNDFGQKKREVKLTGEGYFEVVKMAAHPFIIHTQTIDVKVLGTSFNIRAYADESHTETALISGGVEVIVKDARQQHITLSPHQKLLVSNTITRPEVKQQDTTTTYNKSLIALERIVTDRKDSTIQETAWIDNKFVYRNESFLQLIKRMERWYGITVICKNQQLLNSSFTGNVQEESLEQLLKVLQQSKHFEYNINAQTVVIK
jgi:transmembrane sensor